MTTTNNPAPMLICPAFVSSAAAAVMRCEASALASLYANVRLPQPRGDAELRRAGAVEVWKDPADLLKNLDSSLLSAPQRS